MKTPSRAAGTKVARRKPVAHGMTLETAQAVIAAHREAERQAERAKMVPYIGRFFKYRNSYGGDRPKWWLYVAITDVSDYGPCKGWTFQQMSGGEIEIKEAHESVYVDRGGYQEITAGEFWAAASSVLTTLQERLTRPEDA